MLFFESWTLALRTRRWMCTCDSKSDLTWVMFTCLLKTNIIAYAGGGVAVMQRMVSSRCGVKPSWPVSTTNPSLRYAQSLAVTPVSRIDVTFLLNNISKLFNTWFTASEVSQTIEKKFEVETNQKLSHHLLLHAWIERRGRTLVESCGLAHRCLVTMRKKSLMITKYFTLNLLFYNSTGHSWLCRFHNSYITPTALLRGTIFFLQQSLQMIGWSSRQGNIFGSVLV